jgi:energy-coupling factor transport system ATP-binding protein
VIRFEDVSITYEGTAEPVLRNVSLDIGDSELCLVVGRTGSGKSTLLRAINGLVPHFTGGTLIGRVSIDGRDTRTHRPRELADVVGVVPQDPSTSFVADTVEDEIAYGMECLGLDEGTMRRRVEETLDLLGLAALRHRPLQSLSGGERQRVAIGAVMATHPRVLVLDEPTSALDPGAADDVLAALSRLVHDLGTTVVLAEHRLERVLQYADRLVIVEQGGRVRVGDPADLMSRSPVAPPVVHLGRIAGWSPLPLSVRDARRAAEGLRALLHGRGPTRAPLATTDAVIDAREVVVRYGAVVALRGPSMRAGAGEVVALMGRNGAGKSTFLSTVAGLRAPDNGSVSVLGSVPSELHGTELVQRIGLVPQDPGDLLTFDTVAKECAAADRDARCAPGTTRALLALLAADVLDTDHPRDLSEGQRLSLALAVVLAGAPPVLLLDEPTRGLDYSTKTQLVETLRGLAADGTTIILATHDVELVAEVASRVVVIAEGEIVADGPTAQVVVGSPLFAPQVAKVLAPEPFLTTAEVATALDAAG